MESRERLMQFDGHSETSDAAVKGDFWVPKVVQEGLKEGFAQMKMVGSRRPEIDLTSVVVTGHYTDPLLDPKEKSSKKSSPLRHLNNRFDANEAAVNVIPLKTIVATQRPSPVVVSGSRSKSTVSDPYLRNHNSNLVETSNGESRIVTTTEKPVIKTRIPPLQRSTKRPYVW